MVSPHDTVVVREAFFSAYICAFSCHLSQLTCICTEIQINIKKKKEHSELLSEIFKLSMFLFEAFSYLRMLNRSNIPLLQDLSVDNMPSTMLAPNDNFFVYVITTLN